MVGGKFFLTSITLNVYTVINPVIRRWMAQAIGRLKGSALMTSAHGAFPQG
jgi:hypothetical protein